MKEKEILENNKLIAEFMGWKLHKSKTFDNYNNHIGYMEDYIVPKELGYMHYDILETEYTIKYMKFNSSWNWIMLVVEKIENIKEDNDHRICKYNFLQEQSFIEIIENHTSITIVELDEDTKLEASYKAVIKFINYYNKLKK
jgi:hypothetical protein